MRDVSSRVRLSVTEPADLVFSVAVAFTNVIESETLTVTLNGAPLDRSAIVELTDAHGTRLHRVAAPVGVLEVEYAATVSGSTPLDAEAMDKVEYLRPSRYCDSDRLVNVAHSHLGGLTGWDLVEGARSWVLQNVIYNPGSTDPVDGALETYLSRAGVCRDSTHLTIAFLRARGIPARLVAAYAPGLVPMDFHAVTEVLMDGEWYVIDATGLSRRPALVRIATGRDAADTAFLTIVSGRAELQWVEANAITREPLPFDDGRQRIRIG